MLQQQLKDVAAIAQQSAAHNIEAASYIQLMMIMMLLLLLLMSRTISRLVAVVDGPMFRSVARTNRNAVQCGQHIKGCLPV